MSESIFCSQCGARLPAAGLFCAQCGAQRPGTEAGRAAQGSVPHVKDGARSARRTPSVKWVAAGVMGAICLGSLWVLLRPGPDYSAVSYLQPALYACDFGGSKRFNSYGVEQAVTAERRLDVGRGDWTLTGQDSDWGTLEASSGSLSYDAEDDTLEIQADVDGARISGLSALRFREGTTLAVEYVSTAKDGDSADRVKVEVQFKKEGTAASLSSDFPEWDLPDTGMPFATLKCTAQP